MDRRRSTASMLAVVALAAVAFVSGTAPAAPSAQYLSGGVAVVKDASQQAVIDNGGVICHSGTGSGIGGACVDFGGGVAVSDVGSGAQVAFQVCIDNNGDGICAESREPTGCTDQVYFSHTDKFPDFFNPVGPLPGGFRTGCPGGKWKGYVVFLCEGVHNAGTPHTHVATTGTVTSTPTGTGFGNFCGGGIQSVPKQYLVVP